MASGESTLAATGIAGSELPGPYPVGAYAARLRERLRGLARVQLVGEVWSLGVGRVRVYFELRDAAGALPCAMWRSDWDALGLGEPVLPDGSQVVLAGGCDYYPGSASSSPAFTFRLDSGEGGLRETLELCREGRELVELCASELEAVGHGLEELRLDELVARLEAGAPGGGP